MKDKKGFTLIELLAVIVILGIIMLIAIPAVTGYIKSTREKTMITNAQVFIDAVRDYSTSRSEFPFHGKCKKYYLDEIFNTIGLDKENKKSPYGSEWKTTAAENGSYVEQCLSDDYKDTYKVFLIDNEKHCMLEVSEKDLGEAKVNICE